MCCILLNDLDLGIVLFCRVREIIHRHIYPAVTGKLVHPMKSARVMSVSRNKRRDKVDTILTQVKIIQIFYMNFFSRQGGELYTQAMVKRKAETGIHFRLRWEKRS